MLSIVTDPEIDYIFVTDFDVLEEHLNNILQQACRTESTSTTSTSTTTSASVEPGQSLLQFLCTFLNLTVRMTGDLKKSASS